MSSDSIHQGRESRHVDSDPGFDAGFVPEAAVLREDRLKEKEREDDCCPTELCPEVAEVNSGAPLCSEAPPT